MARVEGGGDARLGDGHRLLLHHLVRVRVRVGVGAWVWGVGLGVWVRVWVRAVSCSVTCRRRVRAAEEEKTPPNETDEVERASP